MSRVLDSGLRDEAIDVVLGLPAVVEMLRQSPLEQLSERLKGHFFSVDLSPAVRRHGDRLAEDRIGLAQLIATPAETQALDQLRERLRELDSQREEAEAKVKQHEVHLRTLRVERTLASSSAEPPPMHGLLSRFGNARDRPRYWKAKQRDEANYLREVERLQSLKKDVLHVIIGQYRVRTKARASHRWPHAVGF
jgi:hypothetical protein